MRGCRSRSFFSKTTPDQLAPIIIVRLRNMTAIDSTGVRALEDLADRVKGSAAEAGRYDNRKPF